MVLDYRILVQFYENDSWVDFPGGISEGTLLLEKGIVKNEIAFGVMYASKFEVQIFDVNENYAGKKVRVVKRKSGVADKVLFTGRVESSNTDYTGVYRDIVAYDDIYYKRSLNVAGWWNNLWIHEEGQTVSRTLAQLFTGVCSYAGFGISSVTSSILNSLPNAAIVITDSEVEQYSKITFEDVIHSICELMGVFPSINGDGNLELIKIDVSQQGISIGDVEIANSYYEDYETDYINRIDVYVSSDDLYLSVGQGNNGYPISGNLFLVAKDDSAIRTICTNLLNGIGGIKFQPCSVKMVVSDLDFVLGQKFVKDNRTSYIFGLVMSGTQFVEQTISAEARGQAITQKASGVNNDRVLRSGVSTVVTKTGSVTIFEVNNIVNEAVSRATQIITGGQGSYVFLMHDNNGYLTEICIADQPGVDELGNPVANNIWRWNSGGLGFSSTGYNGNFGTAITNHGEIVADFITAGTLNASVFNATSIFVSPSGTGNTLAQELTGLQNQIDGTIETYSGDTAPTLQNYPASSWSASDYAAHAGDLFVGEADSQIEGFWYRFQYNSDTGVYEWVHLRDNDIQKAISDAAGALAIANGSVQTTDVEYATSSSSSTAPTSGWSTNAPTWSENTYIWTRTKFMTYAYDPNVPDSQQLATFWYSSPTCITGHRGASGTSVSVSGTEIRYVKSNQGTTPPDGSASWSANVPSLSPGDYLWTRTVVTYSPSGSTTTYSVSYIGTNGTNGAPGSNSYTYIRYSAYSNGINPATQQTSMSNLPGDGLEYIGICVTTSSTAPTAASSYTWSKYIGDDGDPGNGIDNIYYAYKVTTTQTAPGASDSGWQSSIPTLSATNKYLWQKQTIDFTEQGVQDKTIITLIAVYGDTGVSITSVEEWYAVNNDSQHAPASGWDDSPPTMDASHKYLWNYEVVNYSNGTDTETDPAIIGVFGVDGRSVGSVVNWYLATNESNKNNLPTKGASPWTTTVQSVDVSHKYLWNYEIVYDTANSIISQTDECIIGAFGEDGTSVTITSTEIRYIAWDYGDEAHKPGDSASWQSTIPTVNEGQYLWTRTKVVFSQGSPVVSYSVAYKGTNGGDGTSSYTHIRYANSANPTTWSQNPAGMTYIGIAVTDSPTPPSSASGYQWSKFVGEDGDPGNGITSISYFYMATADQTQPSANDTHWSTTVPTLSSSNKYLWQKQVIDFTDTSYSDQTNIALIGVFSESVSIQYMQTTSNSIVRTSGGDCSPDTVTLTAFSKTGMSDPTSYRGRFAVYGVQENGDYAEIYRSASDESEITVSFMSSGTLVIESPSTDITVENDRLVIHSGAYISGNTLIIDNNPSVRILENNPLDGIRFIKCYLCESGGTNTILDNETIVIVTDGPAGDGGYSVILTNENHTFAGDTSAALPNQSTQCQVVAYKGTTAVAAHIGTPTGMPTGMTVTVTGNNTTSAGFTVAVGSTMNTRNGVVNIPVTLDYNTANASTFDMKFTYSLALVGVGVSSIVELYYLSASATTPAKPTAAVTTNTDVTGQWTKQVPTWTEDTPYYYTCSEIHYDDGSIEWTDPVGNTALTQANHVASEAGEAANEATTIAENAAEAAENAGNIATGAAEAVDELGDAVDELGNRVDTAEGDISDLRANMNMLPNGMTLEDFYKNFLELQTGAVFQAFKVIDDGVHIMFSKAKVGGGYDTGEIWMDGANIRFYINDDLRSVINADGFNFDYGILTTALQIGKTGDGTSTNSTWTWVKSQSGHFRLVYKG